MVDFSHGAVLTVNNAEEYSITREGLIANRTLRLGSNGSAMLTLELCARPCLREIIRNEVEVWFTIDSNISSPINSIGLRATEICPN